MGCNSSKNDTTASAPTAIPAPVPTETKAISNEVHTNEQTPIKVENVILEPSDISSAEEIASIHHFNCYYIYVYK